MPSSEPCHCVGAGGNAPKEDDPIEDDIGGGPRPGSGNVIAEGGGNPR
jgi:hypothetical protein